MSGIYTNPMKVRGLTGNARGQHIQISGMIFWRVKDGKIVEEFSTGDHLGFLRQVGVIP